MIQSSLLCAILSVCISVTAPAQEVLFPGSSTRSAREPMSARDAAEGLIHLDVLVTDKAGKPVPGLDSKAFDLLDNGLPQPILSLRAYDAISARPDPPVKVILVIDTIDLAADLARRERVAVESYLRENGGRLTRPISVFLLYETGLWTVAHSTGDGNSMADQIAHDNLKLIRRVVGSQLGAVPSTLGLKDSPSDSALKAIGQIATDERREPGRKLLLWVGPGWGIGSGAYADNKPGMPHPFYTICWFSTLMREARIVLYSFTVGEDDSSTNEHDARKRIYLDYLNGVTSAPKASFMNLYRKVLAVQSGGRVMDRSFDLVHQIESCVHEADSFYTLSFDPPRAKVPDEYHDVKVAIQEPGLTARTSTGYYDQPFYAVERNPPYRHVTVAQLEQLLAASRTAKDEELARSLSDVALTEQLNDNEVSALSGEMPGKRSRQELAILADSSVFFDPPAITIPTDPPPDPDVQRRMLALTASYLSKTIHRLPDYLATRITVRYQELPGYTEGHTDIAYQPLHLTDTLRATVHFRNGQEIADPWPPKSRKQNPNEPQLLTYGTFGPVLEGVLDAIAAHGGLSWGRWERGATSPLAVFRYQIPAEKSLYQVGVCCLPDGDGTDEFSTYIGYHGQITIDPESGAILRLEWIADLKSTTPLAKSDIVIEYGPVEIAGKTYICPVRSISIMRARSVINLAQWDESFRTYGPFATMLNEIKFSNYHVFRSDSRILPGYNPQPDDH